MSSSTQPQYIPNRGHIIWIDFDPQAGHEQAKRRPALVLSPIIYNRKANLCVVCPITSNSKGYPYEVIIPANLPVQGAILSDQVKSFDWKARKAEYMCDIPQPVLEEVFDKLFTLFN